ncbi:hypothetical protein [Aromatoleum sp.]|uniref:hypothetical protein n=1 Tax=Aromatoleum sp. TaxID=2307007 RepID=UPI0039175388
MLGGFLGRKRDGEPGVKTCGGVSSVSEASSRASSICGLVMRYELCGILCVATGLAYGFFPFS